MNPINLHTYEAFLLDYLEGNLSQNQIQDLFDFFQKYPELKPEEFNFPIVILESDANTTFQSRKALKKPSQELINRFDQLCIAELENELMPDEKEELQVMLQSYPALQNNRKVFAQTILQIEKQNLDFRFLHRHENPISLNDLTISAFEGDLSPEEQKHFDELLLHDEKLRQSWEQVQVAKLSVETISYPYKAALKQPERGTVIPIWLRIISAAAAILLLFTLVSPYITRTENKTSGLAFNSKNRNQTIRQASEIKKQQHISINTSSPSIPSIHVTQKYTAAPPPSSHIAENQLTEMTMRSPGTIPDAVLSTAYLSVFPKVADIPSFTHEIKPQDEKFFLHPLQVVWNKTRKFLGNDNIPVQKIDEIQENGLAATTRNEVSRLSNGNIQWIDEEMADGRRNIGVQIGRFEYSRVRSK